MLKLDLMRLETPERFQQLCVRIARREFPDAFPVAFASWDGGRDVLQFSGLEDGKLVHHAVWQAKFTDDLGATTKNAIRKSIETITSRPEIKVHRWILCLPVDPTGHFFDWLAKEVGRVGWKPEIWGKSVLLERLETDSELVETFFWSTYEELRRYFRTDDLELFDIQLDDDCQWEQSDKKVLSFASTGNVVSPDLVLDLILRNTGTVDSVVLGPVVKIIDREPSPHGLPGDGPLFPQITYEVSIAGGRRGIYTARCDPPLIVKAGSVERFKIRLTDTGYSWKGTIVIGLEHGTGRTLPLPAMRIYT